MRLVRTTGLLYPAFMVGVQGFEPWTLWSQTRCARPDCAIHRELVDATGFEPVGSLPYEGSALPLSYASAELPFRQCSRRTAFTVLARCIEDAPGETLQHISAGTQILATAYVANTDEMAIKPFRTVRARRAREGASGWFPRCLHDTKLLMNQRLPGTMT